MNDENRRFKELRGILNLSQESFGDAMGLSKSGISNIENGIRKVTDQHIKLICSEFNVNQDWIRNGVGEMFTQSQTFSLDEQAKKSNLTDLEVAIMRGYMELDRSTREDIVTKLESVILQRAETAATIDPIEAELESYRRELEAEQKGATLLVSEERKKKLI